MALVVWYPRSPESAEGRASLLATCSKKIMTLLGDINMINFFIYSYSRDTRHDKASLNDPTDI